MEVTKTTYRYGEAIPVKLLFKNTGTKVIKLDGILPLRNSANPPALEITGPNSRRIRTYGDGLPKSLLDDKPIVVKPRESVVLIDADLLELSGAIHDGPNPGEPKENLKPFFGKGEYGILARFEPSPQIYWGKTSSLRFTIE